MMDRRAMADERPVRIAWSPRGNQAQVRLLKCQVFEIFFGGARGGGKTDGVLGEFGAHASRYGKDAIGLMVRRSRTELVETIERIAGNLRPSRLETQRDGQDVACAGWRPLTLRLSGARCRCRHVPGPQLHAGLCRGDREFPEPRPSDEVDGDAAVRRGRAGRFACHGKPGRPRASMGAAALH